MGCLNMKYIYVFLTLFCSVISLEAAAITSAGSGNWSDGATGVWDALTKDHSVIGSFGQKLKKIFNSFGF